MFLKGGRVVFCANCGKKRELENRFCTSCGTPFDESIRQETAEQIQGSAEVASKKSIPLKLSKKVLGIIAVLLVGGFFVFKGMSANSPEGVVQTFLTALHEVDVKEMYSVMYCVDEEERKEALREFHNDPESVTDDLRSEKENFVDHLGRKFAQPDNITVVDRDGDEFIVEVDYTTSYDAGRSEYDALFFEVQLKDGKYYVSDFYEYY